MIPFPPRESSLAEPLPTARRRVLPLIFLILALAIASGLGLQFWANAQYVEAAKAFSTWRDKAIDAQAQYR